MHKPLRYDHDNSFFPFSKTACHEGIWKIVSGLSRCHNISDLPIKWIQRGKTLSLALCLICVTPSHITPLLANNALRDGSPKAELLLWRRKLTGGTELPLSKPSPAQANACRTGHAALPGATGSPGACRDLLTSPATKGFTLSALMITVNSCKISTLSLPNWDTVTLGLTESNFACSWGYQRNDKTATQESFEYLVPKQPDP